MSLYIQGNSHYKNNGINVNQGLEVLRMNYRPSMWCNGDCMKWTKNYDDTGKCNECGSEVLSSGEGNPDIDFEGRVDEAKYAL